MVSFWIKLIDTGEVVYDPSSEWNAIDSVSPDVRVRIRDVPTD
ncbi:hypothetical protein [Baekduia sp. Peel2402]